MADKKSQAPGSEGLRALMADLPGMLRATGEVEGNTLVDLHPCYNCMPRKSPVLGLKGMTCVIGGASRGIGQGIALRFAKAGANVCILGRSEGKVSYGPGTLSAVVEQIHELGGAGMPVPCDLTKSEQVVAAVKSIVDRFGSIDVVVNNASALFPYGLDGLNYKYYNTMNSVCGRGSFFLTKEALPYMLDSINPHVLTVAPGPVPDRTWIGPHTAYSATKINMSMQCLAWAEEFRKKGICFNTVWPHFCVATFAVDAVVKAGLDTCVNVAHVADPAYRIVTSKVHTGFFKDIDVLTDMGIAKQPDRYKEFLVDKEAGSSKLLDDFMVEPLGFQNGDTLKYDPLPASEASSLAGKKVLMLGNSPLTAEVAAKAKAAGATVEMCPLINEKNPVPKIEKEVARISATFGGKLDIIFADCPMPTTYPTTLSCSYDYWDDNFLLMATNPYFYLQKLLPLLQAGRTIGESPTPQVLLVAPLPLPNAEYLNIGGSVPFNLISYFRGNYVLGLGTEFHQKADPLFTLLEAELAASAIGHEMANRGHQGEWQINGIWAPVRQSPSADACFQVLANTEPSKTCKFFAEDVSAMPTVPKYEMDYHKEQFTPGGFIDQTQQWYHDLGPVW